MRVNLASGGASFVTGMMLIDDLSVILVPPDFTAIERQPGGYNLIWNSMPSKSYTILFSSTLSTNATWTPLVTNIAGSPSDFTTLYFDGVIMALETASTALNSNKAETNSTDKSSRVARRKTLRRVTLFGSLKVVSYDLFTRRRRPVHFNDGRAAFKCRFVAW